MYDMDDLFGFAENHLQDCLLPMDMAVSYMPDIVVSSNEVLALRQGKEVLFASQINEEQLVRLYDDAGNFFGLGKFVAENRLRVQRLLGYSLAS
jgi:tRNA pseudouridine55 synthase